MIPNGYQMTVQSIREMITTEPFTIQACAAKIIQDNIQMSACCITHVVKYPLRLLLCPGLSNGHLKPLTPTRL